LKWNDQILRKLLLWISRIALVMSVLTLLFVRPFCYCPGYYLALSVAGIVPLLCGPRLYRWFDGAYMLAALLFAAGEHRAAWHQTEKTQHMRAEAHAHEP
jgi:hypothetical protein